MQIRNLRQFTAIHRYAAAEWQQPASREHRYNALLGLKDDYTFAFVMLLHISIYICMYVCTSIYKPLKCFFITRLHGIVGSIKNALWAL